MCSWVRPSHATSLLRNQARMLIASVTTLSGGQTRQRAKSIASISVFDRWRDRSRHVDYWNYLGWKDPYSSPAGTGRQRGYASALGGQVYTPELVVNGATAVVGSNEHRVRDAIKVAQRTISPVQVVITTKPDKSALDVAVSVAG